MTTGLLTEEDKQMAAGYVLGDLEPAEQVTFEQRLANHPALMAEVAALQASLRLMPQGLPLLTPPPQLRDRVLATFAAEARFVAETAEPLASPPPSPLPVPVLATPPIPTRRGFPWGWGVALVTGLTALWLGVQNLSLRQELQFAQASNREATAAATLLQRPNSKLVAMKSTDTNRPASGTLLFTPGKWQRVVVSLGNLPPLPPDQVYRMWLTLQNGQILPCGEFNTNAEGKVFLEINPSQTPPKGVKATGVFVTIDAPDAPLQPRGARVMTGSI